LIPFLFLLLSILAFSPLLLPLRRPFDLLSAPFPTDPFSLSLSPPLTIEAHLPSSLSPSPHSMKILVSKLLKLKTFASISSSTRRQTTTLVFRRLSDFRVRFPQDLDSELQSFSFTFHEGTCNDPATPKNLDPTPRSRASLARAVGGREQAAPAASEPASDSVTSPDFPFLLISHPYFHPCLISLESIIF
jgi:hypothetical protein